MWKTATLLVLTTCLVALLSISSVLGSRPGRRIYCQLEADRGRCRASRTKWHYDSQVGECRSFTWGGCGGNDNKFSTKSLCERVCRPGCIQRTCSRSCEHGYIRDEQGCSTCSCQPAPEQAFCPQIECPDTSCQHGYQTDSHGCQTCDCRTEPATLRASRSVRSKPKCPPVCYMFCEYGNQRDENGCQICRCRTKEEMCGAQQCMMECPAGFVTDRRGCELCECKPAATDAAASNCSDATCFKECTFGFLKDASGCEVCECATQGNRNRQTTDCSKRPMCTLYCPNGFVKGRDGCDTCQCNERSTGGRRSGSSQRRHSGKENNDDCGVTAMCTMFCPNGFEKNSKGCNTCACRSSPVRGAKHPHVHRTNATAAQLPANMPDQLPVNISKQQPPNIDCTRKRCHKRTSCSFGFAKDVFGCDTCVCASVRSRSRTSARASAEPTSSHRLG